MSYSHVVVSVLFYLLDSCIIEPNSAITLVTLYMYFIIRLTVCYWLLLVRLYLLRLLLKG
jgi:hypothetical protein